MLANSAYIRVSASGAFATAPFTINARERIFPSEFAETISIGAARYPIFTEDGNVSSEQRNLLGQPELVSLVAQANLEEGESVHFNGGEICFYLKRTRDIERVGGLVAQVIQLAESVETVEGGPELELLPVQFHPLIPMIEKWAVSDDQDRSDLLEATTKAVLRSLVDEVSPYLEAINAFLDSFGEKAPTEEAVSLGRLAEYAVEAKQRLNQAHTS